MKNIFRNIILLILIFTSGCLSSECFGNVTQGLDVYKIDSDYIVKGKADQKKYYSGKDASEVIQYALDKAKEFGGEVYVHSGTYILNRQINVPSYSSIQGSGNATSFAFGKEHNTGIAISCSGVAKTVVKDLLIKNDRDNTLGKIGVMLDNCGDSFVENISCLGLLEYGIVISNKSFLCEVRGCKIADVHGSAIFMDELTSGGRGGDFVPNLITNCIIYRCGKGIELKHSLCNNIVACVVYQTISHAFHLHSASNSNVISGCRTMQIEDDAVRIDSTDEVSITGNIFAWHDGNGIILNDVAWGNITGNNIIDTGNVPFKLVKTSERDYWKTPPDDIGPFQKSAIIMEDCRGLVISGNAIFNWNSNPPLLYGICEGASSHDNLITSNNINYFTNGGVKSEGKNSIATNNLEVKLALQGRNTGEIHSFDTRLIEEFIDSLY